MDRRYPVIFLLLAAVAAAGCVGQSQEVPRGAAPAEATIEMTDQGFSPPTADVAKGGIVAFKNTGQEQHRPASAVHPVHSSYPQGGGCIGSAFDACRGLEPGEEWSFIFEHEGTWGYHDHLNPAHRGIIIVR